MADFLISSLRGGQNDTDPAIALANDQVVSARNVEFTVSTLGERRRGGVAIDLTGSGIDSHSRVTFLHRHLPSTNETEAELWALAVTNAASYALARKTTTWSNPTFVDAPLLNNGGEFAFQAVTLHGKMFLAYRSAVDRLHLWDGTTLRRAGTAAPAAAPTGANTGSGSFANTRYYRVRWAVKDGDTVLRRSEPSEVLTFAPSGSGTGVVVTRPATTGSDGDETHWELEAALDNANFYVIATTAIATTTATDSSATYEDDFELSEDIGDYTVPHSCEFLSADEDRLLLGGSWDNDELASRVSWTPVFNDPGIANDERIPIDTVNFLDLDGFEGGKLTGLSGPINGSVWAFKQSHIYKLVRTGVRSRAYDAFAVTKKRGALKGSVIEAVDQTGKPTLYFLDPQIGPCRIGANGVQTCGTDILTTWRTVNTDAASVVCRSLYYPEARQVHWWVATNDSDTPDLRIVLQTNVVRDEADGARRGCVIWDGPSAAALATCMYAENIDDDTSRSYLLRPFIAMAGSGLIWRLDTGDTDNGTEYAARIVTKPYTPFSVLHNFGVMKGAFVAKAVTGGTLALSAIRDFGLETKTVSDVSLTPTASETHVIRRLDDFSFSELKVVQFVIEDPADPGARWEAHQLCLKERQEQSG